MRTRLWPLLPPLVVLGVMYLFVALTGGSEEPQHHGVFSCGVKKLTGFHCPGCGGTRCAESIFAGNWSEAMGFNPLVMCGFIAFMALSLYLIVRVTILGKPAPRLPKVKSHWFWLGLAVLSLFTIMRNIPAWPFNLLGP